MGIYIEHVGGWFPFWMAPEQIRILTINDTVLDYAREISDMLSKGVLMHPVRYNEIRLTIDDRNESLGKKIREATTAKIPVQFIVGPRDVEERVVSVRTQAGEEKVPFDQLWSFLMELTPGTKERDQPNA
jgi:threonyl-tRNA synthetase